MQNLGGILHKIYRIRLRNKGTNPPKKFKNAKGTRWKNKIRIELMLFLHKINAVILFVFSPLAVCILSKDFHARSLDRTFIYFFRMIMVV